MERWKAEQGRGREKRKISREKIRRERVRRQKIQMREKVGKSRNTVFFQWFVAPAGQRSDEKLHAVVARSRFPSQNVQNTPFPDHFWKLRCQKSARHCGAKRISKSKVLKTGGLGPLLEVAMSKKCTPFWREAHFEVKMYKTPHVRAPHSTILHYITLHYTPQHYNYNYTTRLHSTTLHYIKFHYATLHYTTLHYTTLH